MPKSNSWLPIVMASYPIWSISLYSSSPLKRLKYGVPWHTSPLSKRSMSGCFFLCSLMNVARRMYPALPAIAGSGLFFDSGSMRLWVSLVWNTQSSLVLCAAAVSVTSVSIIMVYIFFIFLFVYLISILPSTSAFTASPAASFSFT